MHIAEEKVLAVNVYTVSCRGEKLRMVCPFSFSVRFVRLKIQTSGQLARRQNRKEEMKMEAQKKRISPYIYLIIIVLSYLTAGFCQYRLQPILTYMMQGMQIDEGKAGVLVSALSILSIFLAVPFGVMMGKIGPRRTGIFAMILIIAGSLVGVFGTKSYTVMFLSQLVVGAGTCATGILGPYVIACLFAPELRGTTKLRRNGLRGSLSDIEPTKLIEALLQDSRAETMFKAGRKVDLNYFLQHPMYFDLYWNAYKIVMRNNYHISDISLWVDYIRLLERCGKDIRNAHYVCPLDLKAEHDRYQERVRVIQEREKREAEQKKAQENEEKFRELKGKFFGLSFTDGLIVVSVLESVDDYYKEGNALHHCVGQCEYYLKPKSLVFSARIDDKRIETV